MSALPDALAAKAQRVADLRNAAVRNAAARVLASVAAFDEPGERLARPEKGDDISCSGRGSVSAWLVLAPGEPSTGVLTVAEHIFNQCVLAGQRKAEEGGHPT